VLLVCAQVTTEFVVGTTLVILAVYLYSSFPIQHTVEIEVLPELKAEIAKD
jgi:hypothetical protein